jgi:hypothetical protein
MDESLANEMKEMVAGDLVAANISLLKHILTCKECWARYVEIFKCLEEMIDADIKKGGGGDQVSGEGTQE